MHTCFATTIKGLETLLLEELNNLNAKNLTIVNAGVKFSATFDDIMNINLNSRLASRIMLEVGFGSYRDEEDIYNIAAKINWNEWISPKTTIKVATNAINCPLQSLEFLNLKVKDAICDYLVATKGSRPDVNKANPDFRIYNFLDDQTVTIYIDTSGEALFKRGYRENKLEAPLKENLAFGLVALSQWDKVSPLYDPMCGSGTILIEAVTYALNIAPGISRNFAFEKFSNFNKNKWNELLLNAKSNIKHDLNLKVYGSDISESAIKLTAYNLKLANIEKYVNLSCANFLDKPKMAENGVLLCNLPYGVRIQVNDLDTLYVEMASHLKRNYSSWMCYFLTSDLRLPKIMRLKPSRKTPLYNGALECRFYQFKMVDGSNRDKPKES